MSSALLYIGNKNYSSWSLRPWLALRWAGIAFQERMIPLGGPNFGTSGDPAILAVSPSGRVPALETDGATVWDSLAICEWAAERAPGLWPADPMTRAVARSVAAEMHSGFPALRRDLSMNIRRRVSPRDWPEDTRRDIARVLERWQMLRTRYGGEGPWLFGVRSLADAFYAPVCTRFRTYGVPLPADAEAYCATQFADADFIDWERAANEESWTLPSTDAL